MGKPHALIVLTAYTLLALFFTYPLILELNTEFIGSGDVGLYAWNLWWVKKVLLEDGLSLFQTGYLFHPTGVSLAVRELTFYNTLTGVVLQEFLSLPATYNLLVLSSFVLSGLGMYLLARYIVGSEFISFLAGFIYGFSPYSMVEVNAGHLNLVATQWIPFYVLYLMKAHRKKEKINIFYAAVFLFLTNLSSWQYMGMTLIFTAFYIFYHAFLEPQVDGKAFLRVVYAACLGLFLTSPFLYPLVRECLLRGYMKYPLGLFLGTSGIYSIDLASLLFSPVTVGFAKRIHGNLIPVGYTILFFSAYYVYTEKKILPWFSSKVRETARYLRNYFPIIASAAVFYLIIFFYGMRQYFGSDSTCYVQSIVLISATIVLLFLIKDRKTSFWVLSALVFYVLSMGPTLSFLGKGCGYLLPSILLFFAPGGTLFRTPYRFLVFFSVSVCSLFALGLKSFSERVNKGKFLFMIVFALLLFEHGFASYEFTDAQVPDVYRVIKEDKGDYAILEVPIPPVEYHIENGVWTYSIPEVEYYQTLHGKKIVGGYVERQPPEALEFIDTKSPFCQLRNIFSGMKKRECLSTPTIGQLREHNIRFVVVHRELIKMFPYSDNETMSRVDGVINEIFGDLRPFYDDGSIVAYRIE